MTRAFIVVVSIFAFSALAAAGVNAHTPHVIMGVCDAVRTVNGGTADPIYYRGSASRVNGCRTARRVARQATGRDYRARGYGCRRDKRSVPVDYRCSRAGSTIEFSYIPKRVRRG